MALSKTWYCTMNRALDDASTAFRIATSALWAFAATLTGNVSGTNGPEGARPAGAYWTLEGSSNATTAGIDTTDRLHLTTSYTAGDWTRNTAGSAHTWFVLKSPSGLLDGPWYICIDYIGPTNDQTCSIIFANNAFSGGSTTARPTATNEAAYTSFTFISSTVAAGKTHFTTDANGGFRFYISRNATGYFSTAIGVEPLVETHAGDQARTIMWISYFDSTGGAMTTNVWGFRGKRQDNGAAVVGNTMSICIPSFYPSGNTLNSMTAPNNIDTTVDSLPIAYIYDNTTSYKGIRGRIPDLWLMGAQVVPGSTVPSVGTPERMVCGNWFTVSSVTPSL